MAIDEKVVSLSLMLKTEGYEFKLVFPFLELGLSSPDGLWYSERIHPEKFLRLILDSKVPQILRLGNPQQLMYHLCVTTLTRSVHPKPPKVGLVTSLHGPAYTGEKLPITLTLENGEIEPVYLQIQYESLEQGSSPALSPLTHRNNGRDILMGSRLNRLSYRKYPSHRRYSAGRPTYLHPPFHRPRNSHRLHPHTNHEIHALFRPND
jgi:hypothetical protein